MLRNATEVGKADAVRWEAERQQLDGLRRASNAAAEQAEAETRAARRAVEEQKATARQVRPWRVSLRVVLCLLERVGFVWGVEGGG